MAWINLNLNPMSRRVGDCAVRAVAAALGIDWEQAYSMIASDGFQMADVISSDSVWGATLRKNGFYRAAIPNEYPVNYTVADFAAEHPNGIYVLPLGGHVVTVVDGNWIDIWDSGNEVPQYYFYRKDAR